MKFKVLIQIGEDVTTKEIEADIKHEARDLALADIDRSKGGWYEVLLENGDTVLCGYIRFVRLSFV